MCASASPLVHHPSVSIGFSDCYSMCSCSWKATWEVCRGGVLIAAVGIHAVAGGWGSVVYRCGQRAG